MVCYVNSMRLHGQHMRPAELNSQTLQCCERTALKSGANEVAITMQAVSCTVLRTVQCMLRYQKTILQFTMQASERKR